MNAPRLQWLLLFLLVIVLGSLSFYTIRATNHLQTQFNQSIALQDKSQDQKPENVESELENAQKATLSFHAFVTSTEITWNKKTWRFEHHCLTPSSFRDDYHDNCYEGYSRLLVIRPDGIIQELAARAVTRNDQDPDPIRLQNIVLHSIAGSGVALIEYVQNSECPLDGLFAYEHCFTLNYDLRTGVSKSIQHYPTLGTLLWNNTGTKAIFIQPSICEGTCGSKGVPIIVYDLQNDTTYPATKEGAWDSPHQADPDFSPKRTTLPYWKDLRWTGINTGEVKLVDDDKKTEQVIKFTAR